MSNPDVFALKVAWIFHQADYSELRKAEGCQNLGDLPTTLQDKENAVKAAKRIGIADEEIQIFTGTTAKAVNAMIRREINRLYTFAFKG